MALLLCKRSSGCISGCSNMLIWNLFALFYFQTFLLLLIINAIIMQDSRLFVNVTYTKVQMNFFTFVPASVE